MVAKRKNHKNYTPTVDREIDLHGYTTYEAREAVEDFLSDAKISGCGRVRIIVGKGTRSEGGIAVLPDAVKAVLTQYGYTYTYAKIQHGGEGALEITL